MSRGNTCYSVLTALLCIPLYFSCTNKWIQANPPSLHTSAAGNVTDTVTAAEDTAEEVDFADAFDPSIPLPGEKNPENAYAGTPSSDTSPSSSATTFTVPANRVRIALVRNTRRMIVYSVGNVRLHSARQPVSDQCRGRLVFEARSGGRVRMTFGRRVAEASLPCTLLSEQAYNFLEIGDATYRGALILAAGNKGTITAVNFLEVEEYLRGVVPLELGKRSEEEIEALKAQAVAARTYTYRRILERTGQPYDMVATVADQVYGGVSAEYREADRAIKATAGLILTYGDSIILAYYHSTCGGTTANVEEVWDKAARPYLRSVSDLDGSGRAWCRSSAYFTWEESWPWKQFSGIVISFLRKVFPQRTFRGVVNSVNVNKRYSCGRIAALTITGSGWAQECGGDQVRFILRRGSSGNPILRSANFKVLPSQRATIKLRGKGYGHGVGMCQMGAIGRSQAGENFRAILQAYYTGVSVSRVTTGPVGR